MFESFSRNQMIIYIMNQQDEYEKHLREKISDPLERRRAFKKLSMFHSDKLQVTGNYKQNSFDVSQGNFFRPELQDLYTKSTKTGYVKVIIGTKLEECILVIINSGIVVVDPSTVREQKLAPNLLELTERLLPRLRDLDQGRRLLSCPKRYSKVHRMS